MERRVLPPGLGPVVRRVIRHQCALTLVFEVRELFGRLYCVRPMTEKPKLYRRIEERNYSAHHSLLAIAHQSLEKAEAGVDEFHNAFICLAFCALTTEAMANAIGSQIIPEWKDFENLPPPSKIRLLAEHLQVPYHRGNEPWKTIKSLARFRNQLAHPKTELVRREKTISEAERHERSFEPPESSFERLINPAEARNALQALQSLKQLLCEKVPYELSLGLEADGWEISTQPHLPTSADS